ncbi:carbohydrate esterase family 4 protein [Hydnum rufescens UP504]|uniref:chitin deacetylase n=1 Tax=Hydnum rufescens UP504 TaxID=1448309 RepID=A0A9P6B0S8_9AGAM|nr:carbohydrate esterase family 4 protein [Hydnum rufescens UP504]
MISPLGVAAIAFLSLVNWAEAQVTPVVTVVTSSITSVSFHSTNPTAIPLQSIWSGATGQSTVAISSPAAPGATPPIKGAPPLPSWTFSPSLGFPPLDQVPDTNSSLVQEWIKEVANSGVTIPNLESTVPGGCPTNPTLAANTSRCWWSCGGCTRSTDITTCPDKMTWGLSYDDGPSPYSTDLLNYLDANNLKTTFFIVGSRAISRPDILAAEYLSGHQLSVHTWSHPDLTTLTNEQIIAELGWTKKAIHDITGVTPNTWRPPYGSIDDRVRAIGQAMGLTAIIWTTGPNGLDYDTCVVQSVLQTFTVFIFFFFKNFIFFSNFGARNDWFIPAGYPTGEVLDNFANIMNSAPALNTGFIILEHDLYQQTVDLAIGYILPNALSQPQFTLMSIISCLHKPLSDAYIETNDNSTNPPGKGYTTLGSSGSSTGAFHSGSSSTKATQGGQASTTSKSGAAPARLSLSVEGNKGAAGALAAIWFGVVLLL